MTNCDNSWVSSSSLSQFSGVIGNLNVVPWAEAYYSWCFNCPIIQQNQPAPCVNPPRSPLFVYWHGHSLSSRPPRQFYSISLYSSAECRQWCRPQYVLQLLSGWHAGVTVCACIRFACVIRSGIGQDTAWNRRVHGLRVYPVCVCNTVRLGQDTTWNRREHRLSVSPNWVCTMLILIVSAVCIAPIWYFAESWMIIYGSMSYNII